MAEVVADALAKEQAIELLRPSRGLAQALRKAYAWVKRNPEEAQRFHDLVDSLSDKPPEEQEAILAEVERLRTTRLGAL